MVVATNESTRLPQNWEWSGAKHRRYTQDEIERWELGTSSWGLPKYLPRMASAEQNKLVVNLICKF
jgi:hypothetical protein